MKKLFLLLISFWSATTLAQKPIQWLPAYWNSTPASVNRIFVNADSTVVTRGTSGTQNSWNNVSVSKLGIIEKLGGEVVLEINDELRKCLSIRFGMTYYDHDYYGPNGTSFTMGDFSHFIEINFDSTSANFDVINFRGFHSDGNGSVVSFGFNNTALPNGSLLRVKLVPSPANSAYNVRYEYRLPRVGSLIPSWVLIENEKIADFTNINASGTSEYAIRGVVLFRYKPSLLTASAEVNSAFIDDAKHYTEASTKRKNNSELPAFRKKWLFFTFDNRHFTTTSSTNEFEYSLVRSDGFEIIVNNLPGNQYFKVRPGFNRLSLDLNGINDVLDNYSYCLKFKDALHREWFVDFYLVD